LQVLKKIYPSSTLERIKVFGRLTGPSKPAVNRHCSVPCHLYCLVILSIIRRPKRDTYEHFFWQLTV